MYNALELLRNPPLQWRALKKKKLRALSSFVKKSPSKKKKKKLDVDPRRDDDASPMSSYGCMLRPT